MTPDSPTLVARLRIDAAMLRRNSACPAIADDCEAAADALTQARAELARRAVPAYTYGHCESYNQPGGCQQHNLHCGYPDCDRKAAPPVSAGDCREAFEAWATSRGLYVSDRWMFREGWQAALAWRDKSK